MQHALAPGLVVFQRQLFAAGAVENHVLHPVGQPLPGGGQGEGVFLGQGVEIHTADAVGADGLPAAGGNGAVQNGKRLVGDDEGGVGLELHAKAGADGAGAEGIVEREHPGGQLLDGDAAVVAGVVLGEVDVLPLLHQVDGDQAAGEGRGRLHAVGEPLLDVGAENETVHHHLHGVLHVLLHGNLFA